MLTTTTTVIRYTDDPLRRLTGAAYSDGKSFQYDAVGNRTLSTRMITSTLGTTYTYDRCKAGADWRIYATREPT